MPLSRGSSDLHRHARPGVLPPADRGRDGAPRGHAARPWRPAARHRRGVWRRRADGSKLGGTCWGPGPGGTGTSGGATARPGARASRRHPRQDTGGHRLDGAGEEGPNAVVAGRRGQRASRHDADAAGDRTGARWCPAPSPVVGHRWRVRLQPSDARDLACSRASGRAGTPSVAPLAPPLHGAGREALCPAAGGRGRTPHRGWHTRACRDAQASLARRRGAQPRGYRAAERPVPWALGVADASRSGAGTSHADPTAWPVGDRDARQRLYAS